MMNPGTDDFKSGVVAPVECLKEGWELIKDQYWLFLGLTLVAMLIGGAVPIVLLGPMMVGIFLCLFRKMRGEPVEFGNLFKGFDYFVQGLIVTAIRMVPIIVLMVFFYIIMFAVMVAVMPRGRGNPEEASGFVFTFFGIEMVFVVVLVVVSILIETLLLFAFPLVADRNLSGLDAVKLSIKAGRANLGGVVGLLLLNAALGILGVLCCFVGVYFVLPISFASHAVAYRRVFPEIAPVLMSPPPPPPSSWA
ncbi:MAG TPA: hypothetical protein VLQ90_05140 [Pyrinomonadaceae bacterium]|nr:hypothetical protein [Pyrinomonadaceae bacterium]